MYLKKKDFYRHGIIPICDFAVKHLVFCLYTDFQGLEVREFSMVEPWIYVLSGEQPNTARKGKNKNEL